MMLHLENTFQVIIGLQQTITFSIHLCLYLSVYKMLENCDCTHHNFPEFNATPCFVSPTVQNAYIFNLQ